MGFLPKYNLLGGSYGKNSSTSNRNYSYDYMFNILAQENRFNNNLDLWNLLLGNRSYIFDICLDNSLTIIFSNCLYSLIFDFCLALSN